MLVWDATKPGTDGGGNSIGHKCNIKGQCDRYRYDGRRLWRLQLKNATGSAARQEGIYMQSETIEAPGVRNERGEHDTDDTVVHIW